jgi:MOSC domain-containing protein YiiM
MARLLSVNVGLPRDIAWKGRTVHTGVWKNTVARRCRVGWLNLEGDGQGDLAGHGGEHRAVFVYQIESYRYWQEQLKRTDFVYGQFGENFTIDGLADDAVCIGDRFQIGTALFEVTQPRVTCVEPSEYAIIKVHRSNVRKAISPALAGRQRCREA